MCWPMPGRNAAFSVCQVYSCASFTASPMRRPLAMVAAMAEASVQPEPWIGARQALPAVAAQHAFLSVERVDDLRRVLVRAGDEHVLAAARDEALRALGEVGIVFLVAVVDREPARFEAVRRDDRRLRHEQLAQRDHHFLGRELVAAAGSEHRIEHERDLRIIGNDFGDRGDGLDAAEHADLERRDRHVLEHAARLVGDPFRVDRAHVVDAGRVLDGDGGDTDSGWQPMLESVMMSACRPAPPLGSDAAKTSTMGGRSGIRAGGAPASACQ